MVQAITGIDHVVILVRDLDAARSTFQRLGFQTSPRGVHSDHIGTHNHTIMLEDDYFEVLAVRTPTDLNARWREALERREGVHIIALRTPDAAAAAAELRARGVPAGEPVRFSRPVDTPAGPPVEAGFVVAFIPAEATPAANMFACQHLTPELVWLPELREHPNTAERLESVTVVVDDPAAVAEPYAALFGAGNVSAIGGMVTVTTGNTPIRFVTPAGLAARYPGVDLAGVAPPAIVALGIRVRDLPAARVCLDDSGIVPAQLSGGVCVAPEDACGVLVEFRV
ncbi:MAG TPA: VOC family protein [Geminicoccaceae bacterium]|nr:VOC family protein [Geminicoccaceae bacterium]